MTCKNHSTKCSEDACYCPQYEFSEVECKTDREGNFSHGLAKKLAFNKRYGKHIELSDIKPTLTTEEATEQIRGFFTQVFKNR